MTAACIVFGARATRSLSRSGGIAALVAGTLTVAAGWSWGILLVSLFITATALSRLGQRRKAELVGPIVEKDSERDASQVLANGGVYVAAAIGQLIHPSPVWFAIGGGALAASAGDTWATEVGTLSRRGPVSILSWRSVPPGTSGGVTLVGSLAGIAGALFIAAATSLARWPVPFSAVVLGGIAGAVADSVLGATVQSRRWCAQCQKSTERMVHNCGTPTSYAGGVRAMNNDAVNAICCATGALVGFVVS